MIIYWVIRRLLERAQNDAQRADMELIFQRCKWCRCFRLCNCMVYQSSQVHAGVQFYGPG